MSSRSNYSLYAPYVSGSQNKSSSGNAQPSSGGKEAEVDALTDLLVQSMDGSADSDIYGTLGRENDDHFSFLRVVTIKT
jgi:hypothetical protein